MNDELAELLLEAARQLSRYIESTKRRDIETLGRYITDSSHVLPGKLMKAAAELKAQEPEPTIAVPEGWRLVPVEPTPETEARGAEEFDWYNYSARDCYRAMLAAAPQQGGSDSE